MSDWKRTTKEIRFDNFVPEMVVAINRHIELYNLGPILADAMMCIQTNSEKVKKGLFGSAEAVQQGVVLTPRWIVWASIGTKAQMGVLSAQLRDVVIMDYAATPFVKMVPDTGIQVDGRFTDASEDGSAFIGLDENIAGNKFKAMALQAAQDAKK